MDGSEGYYKVYAKRKTKTTQHIYVFEHLWQLLFYYFKFEKMNLFLYLSVQTMKDFLLYAQLALGTPSRALPGAVGTPDTRCSRCCWRPAQPPSDPAERPPLFGWRMKLCRFPQTPAAASCSDSAEQLSEPSSAERSEQTLILCRERTVANVDNFAGNMETKQLKRIMSKGTKKNTLQKTQTEKMKRF